MADDGIEAGRKAAIVIGAANSCEGVDAEYRYVEYLLGPENVKWHLCFQELIFDEEGVPFDKLTIELFDGTFREFWFDISSFYGRY